MKKANLLNAYVVEDPKDYKRITHFIASDGVKPMTPTFQAMLAYQHTVNMVTIDWLRDSYKSDRFLSCEKYLAIHNENIERKLGGVLAGCAMYVCDDLGGNMPKEKNDQLIAASGAVTVNLRTLDNYNVMKLIVLTPSSSETVLPSRVSSAISLGAYPMKLEKFYQVLLPADVINQFENDSVPNSLLPISNIAPQKNATENTETSRPLRNPAPQSNTTEQTRTNETQRKPTIQQKSNTVSKKASKAPSLAKIYEVEQDGAISQGSSSREKAVKIVQKYGFDLNCMGQAEGDGQMELLFSTQLARSPSRTLSNPNIGNPGREFLGANGTLEVYRLFETNHIVVRYIDITGLIKFEAMVPKSEPQKCIFGNSGEQSVFVFDALNKFFSSGGTTVEGTDFVLRRYFFWFTNIPQLSIALFFILNENMMLVQEFFDKNGVFYARGETRPPHALVKGEDDMDIDDYTPVRNSALETAEAAAVSNKSFIKASQVY